MKYHVPVLLNESIKGLSIKPRGNVYVDLDFRRRRSLQVIFWKVLSEKRETYFLLIQILDAIKNNSIFLNNNFELIHRQF